MWDGQGTYMNLMPLLWVPYHMTLINQQTFKLGNNLDVWHIRPYHDTISHIIEHG